MSNNLNEQICLMWYSSCNDVDIVKAYEIKQAPKDNWHTMHIT
jgi:hypothetical protein